MDAIDAFDLERGVKFETYCARRIRGAVLDELRSMDWVPRLCATARRRSRARASGSRWLTGVRRPTTSSRTNCINGEEFTKLKARLAGGGHVLAHAQCFQSDGSKDVREIDVIKDESRRNPFQDVQRRDVRDLVTKGPSRAERLIVIPTTTREMTMKEIGDARPVRVA